MSLGLEVVGVPLSGDTRLVLSSKHSVGRWELDLVARKLLDTQLATVSFTFMI